MRRILLSGVAISALLLSACSGTSTGTTAANSDSQDKGFACSKDEMPTFQAGKLTVATGEVVFEPWMVDDDPSNGKGYESALVYKIAGEMNYEPEDIEWVRTGFDEAIAPGEKDWDFNIQQYSITEDREKVVDFSEPYYKVQQAIIAPEGSPLNGVTSVEELKDKKLGAEAGSTSLLYIDDVIQTDTPASAYDDNVAAKNALEAGQVDGIVFDLPTAFYITAVEIPDAKIIGILPQDDNGDEMGLLFPKGTPLDSCISEIIAGLESSGELEELRKEWLSVGGEIPVLED